MAHPSNSTPLHLHQEKGRAGEYRRHMARAETFLDETAGNAAPFTEQTEKLKLEGGSNEVRFTSFERTLEDV